MLELVQTLLQEIVDTGTELVVMASDKPGIVGYLRGSHGGMLAARAGNPSLTPCAKGLCRILRLLRRTRALA